jgi:hypothetical protein
MRTADETQTQENRTERHSSGGSRKSAAKRKMPMMTFSEAKERKKNGSLLGCEAMVEELGECDVVSAALR